VELVDIVRVAFNHMILTIASRGDCFRARVANISLLTMESGI